MPHTVRRRWEAKSTERPFGEPLTFEYDAYIPDRLAAVELPVTLPLVQEIEATAKSVAELQGATEFIGLEALSRQLLRAESIGSSRIEGLSLSQRRLARALIDPHAERETARAVLGNIRAMEEAIGLGAEAAPFELKHLLGIHARLMEGTSDAAIAGQLRTSQNWIGGTDWSPRQAEFVPPPETELDALLADLFAFMGRDDVPAILQAAVVHAQFETIHPFADGNGRVGRALIHTVLRRRGLAPRFVPPVSLVLATNAARYVEGLTAYRSDQVVEWCLFFTRALRSATEHARHLNDQLLALQAHWREAMNQPRSHSAVEKLIQSLPAQPVIDMRMAAALTGSSEEAARRALNELEAAGILNTVQIGKKRNRIWEARALLVLMDSFEWNMAQPTRSGEPARPSPPKSER
jgi:Fic family protein